MGTGRTSLSLLLEAFPSVRIQAVTHPGDERKIAGIREHIPEGNFDLVLADLATWTPETLFELVLAHQFLGEATHHNSRVTFRQMADRIFELSGKYAVIFDYVEDPGIDWEYVIRRSREWGRVLMDKTYVRSEPLATRRFVGTTYRGILVARTRV